jgi:hypothetical protein
VAKEETTTDIIMEDSSESPDKAKSNVLKPKNKFDAFMDKDESKENKFRENDK